MYFLCKNSLQSRFRSQYYEMKPFTRPQKCGATLSGVSTVCTWLVYMSLSKVQVGSDFLRFVGLFGDFQV